MTALVDYFERKTRDSGSTFYVLTDEAPEWLRDAVRNAHDDEMPNDWRYDICHSIVSAIDDGSLTDTDSAYELADGLTDVYNSALLAWMADDIGRVELVDEVADDMGTGADVGIIARIMAGQCVAIEQMAATIVDAWIENGSNA